VTDGAGVDVLVDLSGAATIGDVITEFNAQLAAAGVANVSMSVNASNTGLVINDTNGVPLGLSISDVDELSSTASDLGIVGDVNPTLAGQDLNPVAFFEVADIAGTTAADLGIRGEFTGTRVGDDLDPALMATALLADLKNCLGLQSGSITISHGELTHTIDLGNPALVTIQDLLDAFNNSGLSITASINASGQGIQVANDDPTRSLIIEETGTDRAAKELGLFGSCDILGSLIALRNSLEADDQEGTGLLLKNLEDGIQHLLGHRATIGARAIRLDTADNRLLNMDVNFTGLLSEVEDADIAKLVTDLAMFENNYQASLLAAAKIIQPSLLSFLVA
jgi:flagellin-like hook-associated protein FlgL